MTDESLDDGEQQMSTMEKVRRAKVLQKRIEEGGATREEAERFLELRASAVEDVNEAMKPVMESMKETVAEMAEQMNEAFEPLVQNR